MIDFKVGGKYENVKGVFEVLSIDGDSMVIQWEDGEKVTTSIEFQQRVLARMQHERDMLQENKTAKTSKKYTSSFGKEFHGLKDSDFKSNVTDTNWRSRGCLGGAVTQRLDSEKFKFNSWAIYRRPMIHWADEQKRESQDAWFQAKYFATVDENSLHYGLALEHSKLSSGTKDNWDVFISWLNQSENETLLQDILNDNDLFISAYEEEDFKGTIRPSDARWIIQNSEGSQSIDSLYTFLENIPKEHWIGLNIETMEKKEDVIEKGETIADDISKIFELLMPVFDAASNH